MKRSIYLILGVTFLLSSCYDYKGQTEHILEMESLMNVEAVLLGSANDTILSGQTVIRFIQGEVVYKDVEVVAF